MKRVYAWRLILAHDGALNWLLRHLGFDGIEIGYTNWAMWIVFSYIWLPFMILPIWSAIERVPDKQLSLPFAVLAAILFGLDLVLSHTRFRRLP